MHRLERGLRDNGNGRLASASTILVTGNSITEAAQVHDDEAYVSLAERALRSEGWSVNLLNAGRAQRSLADYIRLAEPYARVFNPAWTVIQVTDGDFEREAWNPDLAHFEREAGGLRVVGNDQSAVGMKLPSEGYYAPLLAFSALRSLNLWFRWSEQTQRTGSPLPVHLDTSYPVEQELEIFCRAYANRMTLVYFCPFRPEQPTASSPRERAVEEWCRQRNVSFVNMAEFWADCLNSGHAPYGFANTGYNTGHLNSWGHRIAGAAVARELQSLHRHGIL